MFLTLYIILTTAISIWNAHVTGKIWNESKQIGGWIRVLAWAGGIQSVGGFTIVIALLLSSLVSVFGWMPASAFEAIISLTYVLIIVPLLGSGIVITVESWIRAYRDRDWASIGISAWNTFAMASNTFQALDGGFSSALSKVGDFFDSDDEFNTTLAKLTVVAVVGVSVGGAIALTYLIARRSMGSLAAPKLNDVASA